jgi:predicted PurR-regulated permease PerM
MQAFLATRTTVMTMRAPKPNFGQTTSIQAPLITSYCLVALFCLGTMLFKLLPGLLAICVGLLLTSALVGAQRQPRWRIKPTIAATIVIVLPIVFLSFLLANAKGMAFGALGQYQALLHHLATTVLEIRKKLPPELASHLPDEILNVQTWLASYLQSRAQSLTGFGAASLRGGFLVMVGLIVGALIVGTPFKPSTAPLRLALRQRGTYFMESFRQIVVAQFWIAAFNALCTAIFLFIVLPLANVQMPYPSALVALTFFAGLIPIVGNLLCNGILTIAGISISPMVGLACLLFLVAIHKFEYVINAKVVGKRTNTSAWELLIVMIVGESIFGVTGLVAAPLYYAYAKNELVRAQWV